MFQFHNLEYAEFANYFDKNDTPNNNAILTIANANPGFPCRVSLDFAPIGTKMLLINFNHHQANSPYASKYAIFVAQNAKAANLEPNELPPFFKRNSPIAFRGFDKNGFLKIAEIAMAPESAPLIERIFENPEIEYIHAHFAAYGCFAAKITRA